VEPPFAIDEAHFGRANDRRMSNAHLAERALQIMGPKIEKLDEAGETGSQIVLLPKEELQNVTMIGQPVHDLRRRQAPAAQLSLECFVDHRRFSFVDTVNVEHCDWLVKSPEIDFLLFSIT
jgi:hypothetical protein